MPDPLFEPRGNPSPLVSEYLHEHPEFIPSEAIKFVASNYPSVDERGTTWVLEGGYAVEILTDGKRVANHDIDILCRDDQMESDFHGINYFDIKTVDFWIRSRKLKASTALTQRILDRSVEYQVGNTKIRVLDPLLIAAAKTLGYWTLPPRGKDLEDVFHLGLGESDLDEAINFLSAEGEE